MSKQGWIETGNGDRVRVNDDKREQWVGNDEGLYDLMRSSNLGMRAWVRANRELIDSVIQQVTSGAQPAHYLKYGG